MAGKTNPTKLPVKTTEEVIELKSPTSKRQIEKCEECKKFMETHTSKCEYTIQKITVKLECACQRPPGPDTDPNESKLPVDK
ncbi:hypothetical protein KUTeg_012604 [Tegillarca granosa]|uniref:Uncharacterized protein n=1 Tax=Tegillarca granosa TaxID=220873 RepID=A0ABQ9F081_TEGGR|nr:hypothetical protein KUTeg_012604 [Tegillarca granosa]